MCELVWSLGHLRTFVHSWGSWLHLMGQTRTPPGKINMDKTICSSGNLGRGIRGRGMKSLKGVGRDDVYGEPGFVGWETEE